MKKIVLSIFVVLMGTLFSTCDSADAVDCFQTEGDLVDRVYDLEPFKKIIIWKRVRLVISDGPRQRVFIRAGENLFNDLKVRVEDSILKVSDRNSCNLLRGYEAATVFVTSPDITEIRNSSGLTVSNIGTIGWKRLTLISEDRDQEDEFHIDGDFNLDNLATGSLRINANGISTFRLKGTTFGAFFGLFDGDVRVEAEDLEIRTLTIFHRSTNQMIVNPIERIDGRILGLGDVIAKNRPPVVEVEELFTGRLIFD